MATYVKETWLKVTSDLGISSEKRDEWWCKIIGQYSEDGRYYHNYESLAFKFKHLHEIESKLKNPLAVALAIIFQYFQYDTKSTDCHKRNTECFTHFCTSCGLDTEGDVCSAVINLLETTDTSSTEEHKVSGLFGNEDQHYFLDIDMVVLGSDPEHYAEYSSKIQQEYSFLSPVLYKNLRMKVLQNFLQIPNIFATKEFREKYEEQARNNILHEIKQLK